MARSESVCTFPVSTHAVCFLVSWSVHIMVASVSSKPRKVETDTRRAVVGNMYSFYPNTGCTDCYNIFMAKRPSGPVGCMSWCLGWGHGLPPPSSLSRQTLGRKRWLMIYKQVPGVLPRSARCFAVASCSAVERSVRNFRPSGEGENGL